MLTVVKKCCVPKIIVIQIIFFSMNKYLLLERKMRGRPQSVSSRTKTLERREKMNRDPYLIYYQKQKKKNSPLSKTGQKNLNVSSH